MSGTRTGTLVGILSLGAIALMSCIGIMSFWTMAQPAQLRPNVSVTLAGYTNNAEGSRLAIFNVTNPGPASVFLYNPAVVGMVYASSNFPTWHKLLKGRDTARFVIAVPTNQASWKVGFEADPNVTFIRRHRLFMARHLPFSIYSEIVTNGN
jgi:hypothetical protein